MEKVFSLEDLQRIAKIFERQQDLAKASDAHANVEYEVNFSDNTSIESNDTNLLADDFLVGPSRPIQVRFSFRNYSLNQRLDFTINHGESSSGNKVIVSGDDQDWVRNNLLALKDAIDTVPPQSFWFRRHKSLLLHLIALGIGSLGMFSLDILLSALIPETVLNNVFGPIDKTSPWVAFVQSIRNYFYAALWVWRWLVGHLWGAHAVRTWLLSLWPNIEFDFGAKHLNIEKTQRKRIAAVISLIVIPIVATIIYDFIKYQITF